MGFIKAIIYCLSYFMFLFQGSCFAFAKCVSKHFKSVLNFTYYWYDSGNMPLKQNPWSHSIERRNGMDFA